MVNRNLIRSLENDDFLNAEIDAAVAVADETDFVSGDSDMIIDLNKIVEGRIIRVNDDNVLIDVGFKSEGVIPLDEWEEDEEPPKPGETVKVLVEELDDGRADDPYGMITLSKRKAEKIIAWQEMMKTVEEGQVVTGT